MQPRVNSNIPFCLLPLLQHLLTGPRQVFEAGLNDGVTCVIDFNNVKTKLLENGVAQYQRADGAWADKTEGAGKNNGWTPHFIAAASAALQNYNAMLSLVDGDFIFVVKENQKLLFSGIQKIFSHWV